MASFYTPLALIVIVGWFSIKLYSGISSLYFSKLSNFPGPKLAGATHWWRAVVECFLGRSFCHALEDLHAQYGEVVRVAPDELHFSNPQAYHDIYNNANRWDKDVRLYHAFNEDRSSFGFLTYREAKERKDVLNRLFSPKAVSQVQDLVEEKIDALCTVFEKLSKEGKPVDLDWSFRCMTVDIITYLCFGNSVGAINEPDFKAAIIVAMDASLPGFVLFKHFAWYKNMILGCPPEISKVISPPTAGLVELQQILKKQIADLHEHPEHLQNLPHNNTIFHHLLDKSAHKGGEVPSAGSLYEEAQALMFAGADTTGSTLMVALFNLLKKPTSYDKLKKELLATWPDLKNAPALRDLEKLPYLNATLKEALRLTGGVVSGLMRIVPEEGAKICGAFVPGGTAVSCGSTFVHYNAEIFPDPMQFSPERWLNDPDLDQWLVAFSRGPRACLGINLAWMEMRLSLAHVLRRFDWELDPSSPKQLRFQDTFLPLFQGDHVKANATTVPS